MYGMISSNAEAVTITGNDPHAQFRPRCFQSRSNRGSSSVDGMHSVGVHVIRKAAAATDSRYDHDIFARNVQCWHYLLHLREYGVIPTTGTPTHFLIGGEVFRGEGGCYSI